MEIEEELQAMRFMRHWAKNVAVSVPLTNGDLMVARRLYLTDALKIMKEEGRLIPTNGAGVYAFGLFCEEFGLRDYVGYFRY